MTTLISCDACGKTAKSNIEFAAFSIDPYMTKSVIKDVDKEACSPACLAMLLRETAEEIDPGGGVKETHVISNEASAPVSVRKPGFFAKLFR